MTDKNRIVAKIKKCLALSKSSNEHEAAAALRQAQKLMREYQVTDDDIALLEVSAQDIKGSASQRPPNWEVMMVTYIAKIFGCQFILTPVISLPSDRWIWIWQFIGCGPNPEIAQYAFKVLYRQCKNARAEYMKTALKRVKKISTKTVRADFFCTGWVESAVSKISDWPVSAKDKTAIDLYFKKLYPETTSGKAINRTKNASSTNHGDYWRGSEAGDDAIINRGMDAGAQAPAIGFSE